MDNLIQKAKSAIINKFQELNKPKLISAQVTPIQGKGTYSNLGGLQGGLLGNTLPGKVVTQFGNDLSRTVINIGAGIGTLAQSTLGQAMANKRERDLRLSLELAKRASTSPNKQALLSQSRNLASGGIGNQFNLKLAEANLAARQKAETTQTGIKSFLQYAAPATNVALTEMGGRALGAMAPTARLTTLGTSALLSGGAGALSGQNPIESATAGLLQTPRIVGLTGVTSPLIKYGASGIMDKFATPLARNIVGRTLTGLGNVIEDELLSRLDNIKPGLSQRVMSFGLGALLAPTKEYEDFIQSGGTGNKIKEVIRDLRGRYAKEAGIKPKSLDYMVEDPNSRQMVLRSKLDEKIPGLMSDVEKLNKYLEQKTNGFGNIAKSVRDEQGNILPEYQATKGVEPKTSEFNKLGFETKGNNVVIHRGTGPSSPLEGNYFTGDKEYAREFLGTGRPEELKTVSVPAKDIYIPKVLPEAVSEQQMASAISEARSKGYKAVLVDEYGSDTPSVFYVDKVNKDFYTQATKGVEPLMVEARKYKSAEELPKRTDIPHEPIDLGDGKIMIFRGARSPEEAALLKSGKFAENKLFKGEGSVPMTTDYNVAKGFGNNFNQDYLDTLDYLKQTNREYLAPKAPSQGGGVHAFIVDKDAVKPFNSLIGEKAAEKELTLINQGKAKYLGEIKSPENIVDLYTQATKGVEVPQLPAVRPGMGITRGQPPVTKLTVKQQPKGKLRGFAETIIADETIPKEVRDFALTQTYEPLSNKTVLDKVSKIVKQGDSQAISFAKTNESTTGNATAMVMIRKLIDSGRFNEANDLIEAVSPRFTKQGQQIQILSQFGRLKPEGAIKYAQNLINKINKENPRLGLKLTPENTQTITNAAKAIESLPEGSRERTVAIATLMKEINDIVPVSTGQKIATAQTIAQLLNFKTPIRNVLGNAIFGTVENVKDVVGTAVDIATSKVTGQRTKVLPSLKAQGMGLLKGSKEGFEDITKGISTGPGTQYELPNQTFKSGILNKLEKTLGVTLQVPDRAAYTAAYEGSLNNQMRAMNVTKPTEKMMETAQADALYRTFQDNSKLAQVFSGIKKVLNKIGTPDGKFGLGDLILKYPKTPANILSRGIDYSPAGFVKGLYEVALPIVKGGEFNQKAFVEDLSRSMVGTGLISAAYVLANNGIISGKSPKDYDISSTQQSQGGGQFKINLDALRRYLATGEKQKNESGDKLVSYDWAQPTSILFSMGADMALNGTSKNAITDNLDTATQTLTGQPLVKGLTDFAKSTQDKGVGSAIAETALAAPAGFTPSILNQFASLFDKTARQTYSPDQLQQAKNKVITRIPGLRNTLEPRVDVFGKEVPNYESQGIGRFLDVMFNPAFVSTVKNNPAAQEVLDIYNRSGETQQAPRVAPKSVKINGQDIKLTPEQYTKYQKYIGQKTNEVFNGLILSPVFIRATDEDKAKLLSNTLSDINSAAKIELFGNKPKKIESGVKQFIGKTPTNFITYTKEGNLKTSTDITEPPKLTGYAEIDKKLVSSYKSSITTKINDVVASYNNGDITAEKANEEISSLNKLYNQLKSSSPKKPKKLTIKTPRLRSISFKKSKAIKLAKIKIPKMKLKKIKAPKLAKLKTIKVKA